MARHSWIGGRNRSIDVARVTDDPVEFLVELNRCSKKPPICIGSMRSRVGEVNRMRSLVVAQQLLETAVKKAQAEFNSLAHRHRPPNVDGKLQSRRSALLLQGEKKGLAVQIHVADEDLNRAPDRRLLS